MERSTENSLPPDDPPSASSQATHRRGKKAGRFRISIIAFRVDVCHDLERALEEALTSDPVQPIHKRCMDSIRSVTTTINQSNIHSMALTVEEEGGCLGQVIDWR